MLIEEKCNLGKRKGVPEQHLHLKYVRKMYEHTRKSKQIDYKQIHIRPFPPTISDTFSTAVYLTAQQNYSKHSVFNGIPVTVTSLRSLQGSGGHQKVQQSKVKWSTSSVTHAQVQVKQKQSLPSERVGKWRRFEMRTVRIFFLLTYRRAVCPDGRYTSKYTLSLRRVSSVRR